MMSLVQSVSLEDAIMTRIPVHCAWRGARHLCRSKRDCAQTFGEVFLAIAGAVQCGTVDDAAVSSDALGGVSVVAAAAHCGAPFFVFARYER